MIIKNKKLIKFRIPYRFVIDFDDIKFWESELFRDSISAIKIIDKVIFIVKLIKFNKKTKLSFKKFCFRGGGERSPGSPPPLEPLLVRTV